MKNLTLAMFVAAVAAGHEGDEERKGDGEMRGADMAKMEGPPPPLEMMCWEWDQGMCNQFGMRCARVEPSNWDFNETDEGRMIQKERNNCTADPCPNWDDIEREAKDRFNRKAESGKREEGFCVKEVECNEGKTKYQGMDWWVMCYEGGYGSATGLAASVAAVAATLAYTI